jgi:hypothetical protein
VISQKNPAYIGEALISDYQERVIPREVQEVSVIPTREQEQLVVGTTLGDGYLYPNGRLQLEHQEKFKTYLLWKYEILKPLTSGVPKRCDKRTKKEYVSWRFYTKTVFKEYRELFYPGGQKIVPEKNRSVSCLSIGVGSMVHGRWWKRSKDS